MSRKDGGSTGERVGRTCPNVRKMFSEEPSMVSAYASQFACVLSGSRRSRQAQKSPTRWPYTPVYWMFDGFCSKEPHYRTLYCLVSLQRVLSGNVLLF